MNIHKLFSAFRRKLLLENAINAALSALTLGAAGVFCVSLIYHILVLETPAVLLAAVGGGIFLLAFGLFFILGLPKEKTVAKRVDSLGLQERASTMLEFSDDPSVIAQLQRQDAAYHIALASAKQLSIRVAMLRIWTFVISISLAVPMVLLPHDIFAVPPKPLTPEEIQQQLMRQVISQLREDVKNSELEQPVQDSIEQILAELEQALKEAEGDLERAAEIQEAIDKLQNQQKELSTREKIGKALQKYTLTKALGEGIYGNNTKTISAALAQMEAALAADKTLVPQLNDEVVSALVDSEVVDTDSLYVALTKLTYPLALLDTEAETYAEDLHAIFEEAEAVILEALKRQVEATQQIQQMQDRLQAAMNGQEYQPQESERPDEGGEPPEDDAPEGEPPEGEQPENAPGGGNENGETQPDTRVEGFYDPISGSVSYGEVYGIYYAEYLKALENGNVPRYLQEIMDRYFAALE